MSGVNRKELIKWLNDCIYTGNHGEGIRFFALRHLVNDDRATPVREWPYKNGFDVDAHADDMINTMEMDAGGLRSAQQYVLEAYFGTSKTRGRRKTYTIDPPNDTDQDGLSEPAGPKGEAMQIRRHNENLHKMSVGSSIELIRILRNENDALRTQLMTLNEQFLKTRLQMVETYESLVQKNHERSMDYEDRKASRELRTSAVKQAMPLLTVFANRAMGEKLLPEARPVDLMIMNIAKELIENPAKMQGVVQLFGDRPEILAQLHELISQFKVVDEAAQ